MLYRLGEYSNGVLGAFLAVDFEGFGEGIGHVIRFVEVLGLDCCGSLEGLAGFFVCRGSVDANGGCPPARGMWRRPRRKVEDSYSAFAFGRHSLPVYIGLLHSRISLFDRQRD